MQSLIFRSNNVRKSQDQGHSRDRSLRNPGSWNAYSDLELALSQEPARIELTVELGRRLKGTIVDPEGKPLSGVFFSSPYEAINAWTLLETPEFEIKNLDPVRRPEENLMAKPGTEPTPVSARPPRRIDTTLLPTGKKLAGWIKIDREETGPLRVRLEPWGAITGRIVDNDEIP